MTPAERRNPDILKASRKKRIAAGAGSTPEHINRLLKMHRGMADMMKAMGSGKRGPMAGLANALGMGGGMPSQEEMQKMAEKMQGGVAAVCRRPCRICRRIFRDCRAVCRDWADRNCRPDFRGSERRNNRFNSHQRTHDLKERN